jgi:hypothetical protein
MDCFTTATPEVEPRSSIVREHSDFVGSERDTLELVEACSTLRP